MGAKVQCNTYLPGYYHMKDLNDDVRSTVCSQFYDDRMMKGGQFCNGFMQPNTGGYSEYDKEVLKQTMLKHEAIFRKQVCELHRLYQVQKNLMDDLKRKEMIEYSLPLGAMHDSQCILQMRSDSSQKIWQMPMPSVGSSSCSRQSASETDNMQSSLTLLRESSNLQKYSELQNSKINKFPRTAIDLRLPADEYIDHEDRELSVEEVQVFEASSGSLFGVKCSLNRNPDVVLENEVKLTLSTGCNASMNGDHLKSETHSSQSIHGYKTSKLNGNHRGGNKEVATSFGVPGILVDEIRSREPPLQPSAISFGLPNDHVQGNNFDNVHRHYWNFLDSECEGSKGDWRSSNLGPGQNGSMDTPFVQRNQNDKEQLNFGKSHDTPRFCLPEWKQKESWFSDQRNAHVEFPKMNVIDPRTARATGLSTSFPGTFSVLSQPNLSDTASAELFTQRKLMTTGNQLTFGFQSPAYLDRSTGQNLPGKIPITPFQSSEFPEEKWHPSGSLRSGQSVGIEVLHRNGFNLSEPDVNRSFPSFPSIGLGKIDLNNGECSSYGHSADSSPRKLLKGLDCLDVKSNKGVSLTLAMSNGPADDAGSKNQSDLLFDKGSKRGNNLLDRQHMLAPESEVKKNPSKSVHINNGAKSSGLCISRLFHQPMFDIDLEKPLQIESEMEALREKPAKPCDVGSVSQLNSGPGPMQHFVVHDANKHGSTYASETTLVQSSSSSKFNFLKEPFAVHLPSESIKDRSKVDGFQNHKPVDEPQGNYHNDLKVQDFRKQACVDQAHGRCACEDAIISSLDIREGKSIRLEVSLNDPVNLLEMEHESTTKGFISKEEKVGQSENKLKAVFEETPLEQRVNLGERVHSYVKENHQIDLSWPGDTALLQTSELPVILTQKISCTEKSIIFDDSPSDERCGGSGGCAFDSSKSLVSMAAEALIMISSFPQEKLDCVAWNQPEAALTDSLKWFADLACSDAGLLEPRTGVSRAIGDDHSQFSDEEDFFESMTLMLRETKMDKDYCYKPQPQQEPGEPETDTSPAKNQSTRRAPRRGRRQRDFRRDILPGLMSLSRHEVAEDMQMIYGLMRASGCFWQTGLIRRNGYRNEWSSPTRGRRSRCISMATEVNEAVLSVLQPTCDPEIVDETVSLQGFSWGKTTRRRRMQRCPSTVPTSCTTKKS